MKFGQSLYLLHSIIKSSIEKKNAGLFWKDLRSQSSRKAGAIDELSRLQPSQIALMLIDFPQDFHNKNFSSSFAHERYLHSIHEKLLNDMEDLYSHAILKQSLQATQPIIIRVDKLARKMVREITL